MKTIKYYRRKESSGEFRFTFFMLKSDGRKAYYIDPEGIASKSDVSSDGWLDGSPPFLEEVPAAEVALMFGFLP